LSLHGQHEIDERGHPRRRRRAADEDGCDRFPRGGGICCGKAAAKADEAIRLLERREDIRPIFTDINMPGSMDGLQLAQYVREHWPAMEIVVTSGHMKAPEKDMLAGCVFFAKPYRPEQITKKLQQMIGNPA
jgi:CheY-like chemotaxis protein